MTELPGAHAVGGLPEEGLGPGVDEGVGVLATLLFALVAGPAQLQVVGVGFPVGAVAEGDGVGGLVGVPDAVDQTAPFGDGFLKGDGMVDVGGLGQTSARRWAR